jgi:hypothetical protein
MSSRTAGSSGGRRGIAATVADAGGPVERIGPRSVRVSATTHIHLLLR